MLYKFQNNIKYQEKPIIPSGFVKTEDSSRLQTYKRASSPVNIISTANLQGLSIVLLILDLYRQTDQKLSLSCCCTLSFHGCSPNYIYDTLQELCYCGFHAAATLMLLEREKAYCVVLKSYNHFFLAVDT